MDSAANQAELAQLPPRAVAHLPFHHGVTFRQAATTLLVALVLGVAAGLVELYFDWKALRTETVERTERTLKLLEGSAAEAAFQFNETLAAQVVDGLMLYKEVRQAVLKDNFGKVLASQSRQGVVPGGALVHSLFGDLSAYALPLYHGDPAKGAQEVGRLEVELSDAEIATSFMKRGLMIFVVGLVKALGISLLVVVIFYFMITRSLLALHSAITRIDPTRPGAWPRPRLRHHDRDELGQIVLALDELMAAFQRGLEQRDRARDENARLGAELDVSRRIQQIILPSPEELAAIDGLDIATYMEPATEVGGDYYDVLKDGDRVRIGIGDVTGHGLESGMVMLMTQSAVRTLLTTREEDVVRTMEALNSTIYNNVQRMGCGKNLTLALLDYRQASGEEALASGVRGHLRITGQHECIVVARHDGSIEILDTDALGFPIGLVDSVGEFVAQADLELEAGDVVVLYTDGITEAADEGNRLYSLERLTGVVADHHAADAAAIKEAIVADVKRHIGRQVLYDDLTLVILKQR